MNPSLRPPVFRLAPEPAEKIPNPPPLTRLLLSLLLLLTGTSAWAGIGVQRIQNGNFSRYPITSGTAYTIAPNTDLGAWRSGATYVNTGTRPGLGRVSIQRMAVNYTANNTISTVQSTFPGDAANGVPASTTFLLYRGSAATAVWYQVASVRPNTTYNFSFYASNANAPGTTTTPVPVLQFQNNGVAQGSNVTLANEPVGGDVWTRYNFSFTTGPTQTVADLRLVDLTAFGTNANGNTSDQLALTGISLRTPSADAGASYSCDGSFYQARQVETAAAPTGVTGNSTRLFEVNRSVTPYITTELQDLGGTFNGLGYNAVDGYMYALTYTGNVNPGGTDPQVDRATDATSVVELVKIGRTGLESLGEVAGLPVDQWAAGTFDRSGNLYVKNQTSGTAIYRINVNTTPLTATLLTASTAFTAFDLAFDPVTSQLYATYFPGVLYSINPTTGAVTTLGAAANTQALGTAFFDISGNLYAYSNGPTPTTATSGNFYLINKTSGAATIINSINGATNSDGASCINPLQRIDVVKRLTNVVPVNATTYDITYVVQVKNTGTVTDENVQVSDLLRGNASNTTFPTATGVALQSIAVQNFEGATLAANTGFTGVSGGASLLTGTQSLSPNQRATITFTVRVTFGNGVPAAAQNNTAYATSTSTGPNNGYTQLSDGTLLTPFDLVANDASTNSGALPPNRGVSGDPTDTPSSTPVTFTPAISGTVFEDVNYGGGAGRLLTASQGVGRSGARVELYSSTGNFLTATTTDGSGNYTFSGLAAGATYTVRVVNSTVTSSRNTNNVSGLLPVQTFVYNDVNRVGGEAPNLVDAGSNTTSATLASLTAGNATPQSITRFTLSAGTASPTVNVNFGYNFNTIVNTNSTGQGSLRQFITNANALVGEAALAQAGSNAAGSLPAGQETSIFMIPGPTAVPGLRTGLTSQLTNGVAVLAANTATAGALPPITGANTRIDGTTQTFNLSNPNNVTLGAGGNVGTTATALSQLNGPEVQLVGTPGQAGSDIGLDLRANNIAVTGLSIFGFGNTGGGAGGTGNTGTAANIVVNTGAVSGTSITGNVIGSAATSFADPGAAARSTSYGILFTNTSASTLVTAQVSNNLIGFNGTGGVEIRSLAQGNGTATDAYVAGSSTGIFVENNEIRSNALFNTAGDGISSSVGGGIFRSNLLVNNAGPGVDILATTANAVVYNNTISNNGAGNAAGVGQTAGVRVNGSGSSISQNIISNNYGAGVLVRPTGSTTVISQNSIFGNGTIAATNGAAASGQIGIDLVPTGGNVDTGGVGSNVTLNDSGDGDTGGNGLLNFPVITSATVSGSNLIVQGFARPGAVIELFNPGTTADPTGFGEGQTFLGTFTEGSAADLNTETGSYSGLINGRDQGSDNTNRFRFSIPLTGAFAGYTAGSLLTGTATLASATSEFAGNATVGTAPVPNSVTNVAIPNTNGATVLNPNLSATAGTGASISFFTITSLPASGTLTYNGTVLTSGNIGSVQILPSLLNTLTYTPVSGFTGSSVSFSYTATDANGVTSATNNTGGTISSGPAVYTIPVVQVADVATSITPSPSPVNAGSPLSFAVTYTNAGPNTAADYTQTLTLTAGLGAGNVTFSNLPAGVTASYNNTTGVVTFSGTPTTLASGANQNLTVNIASVPGNLTQVVATTTVGTSTNQGANTGANSATSTVTVTPIADVTTTITPSANPVDAGSPLSFVVTFVNNGPSTAADFTRTISLPAGLGTGVTITGGTYNNTTGAVTFTSTPATLASGANANVTVTIPSVPTSFGGGSITASSTTGTSTSQGANLGPNAASSTVTVRPIADVTTTLNGPTQLNAGQPATFSVTYTNEGPTTASTVTRVVTLPAGATLTAAQLAALPAGATYNSGPNTINFGNLTSLASGASSTLSFSFTAPATTGGATLTSTTTTASSEGPNLAPNTASLALTVNAAADVAVTLTPGATPVVAGQPASFTLSYTNSGPQTAAGTTVSVQLPAGLLGVSATNGGSYNSSTGVLTYTVGNLPAGTTASSVISFTAPASGSVTAVASISTTTNEGGQTANNTASSTIRLVPGFDLTTTLSGPASAQPGNLVTLNVTTTNNSGQAALSAVQTVQLVAGLSDVFVSNGGLYDSGSGLVTFPALASLAAGQTVANTISFAAPATAFAPTATVTPNTAATGDSNPANNTAFLNGAATATNIAIQAASATLANSSTSITASAQTVAAGTPVTLTVVASNAGPAAASGLTQTVQLLPGLSGVVASNGGTYDAITGVVTFPAIASLASGASQSYTIAFTAPANTGNNGQLLATASVHSNTADPIAANNVDAVTIAVQPSANLAAAITGPATAVAGQQLTYSTSFSNAGPAAATNVVATTQLRAGLSGVLVLDANGATVAGAYNAATGLVTFPTVASMGAGTVTTYTISFAAPATGSLALVSSVSSTTPDAVTANNTASTTTTISPSADVTVALSGPATAVIGNAVTYAVTTTNNGSSAAATVAPTLQLISGLTILSLPAGASYDSGTGLVTFAPIASLPSGASQSNSVSFVMPNASGGQLTGTASASTATADPNPGNNTQALQTSVAPATTNQANLSTTLTPSATTVAPGATLTLTATFGNAGPAAALNVAPVAYLPAGLSGVVVSDGGSYNAATGQVTWPLIASQASGSTATYTISLTAPANGPLVASSATSSATSDPTGGNNAATTSVTITASYDEVTTLSGPVSAQPNASLTYTVQTINNGPSNTPSATQTVTLPVGVVATNISGGGTQTGTVITFPAISNQAPGAAGAVVNTFTVTMPATGSLALTASVTAAGEANTGNNTAAFTTSPANQGPVAGNVMNNLQNPIGNTAVATAISPLVATDADGSIASYTILSLPAAAQGVLLVNGVVLNTTNFPGLVLTPAQAAQLQFDPVATFVGNATFTYAATDNQGTVSNTALYTIPMGNDTPADYTLFPPSGGQGNPYPTGSTLASVLDVNGAAYNAAGTQTSNGLASAVLTAGTLPAGTTLNPTTGAITVTNASQLVSGSYPLTIVTTDLFGGVTQHVITLVIGATPIAVDDFASTLPGVAVTFAVTGNDLANGGPNIQPNSLDLNPAVAGIQTTVATTQGTFTTVGAVPGSVTFTPAAGFSGTATLPYIVQNIAGAFTNQANLVVTVAPAAPVNLSTTISASTNPVNAGALQTLTIVATNNSTTTTATGVVQTVSIPAGLTAATLTVGGQTGTPSGNTITFANGATYNTVTGLVTFATTTLAAAATQTFTVAFAAPAAGPFAVTAQVGNGTADPVPADNTATVLINVNPQFDLSTTIAGPTAVVVGNLVTFTVQTINNGANAAPLAVQTVQLPAGLTGVFATNGGVYDSSSGQLTFPPVAMASGENINNTVSFPAPAAGFTASATVLPNTAASGDQNTANNTATAPATTMLPSTGTAATSTAPLAGTVANTYVTISGPTTALPGQTGLTYTITQGNDGPTAASNVQTQASLPAGLSGVVVSNGGSYNASTGVVTFPALGSQASSGTQTYTISLTAPATGALVMVSASTTANTTDPMAANNVATSLTTLTLTTDVVASISGPTTLVAGQLVAYTVTLRNASATPATSVVGTVQLVAGLTASDLRLSGLTGTLSGSTITFADGASYNTATGLLTLAQVVTLAPGEARSYGISFPAPAVASLAASASARTSTPETSLANNTSATTATVSPAADVTVQVSGPASATAGNLLTYAIETSNSGPSVAASVTTTVQLPTGLNNVTVRDNTGTVLAGAYNSSTGVVTFPTIANLPTGLANQFAGTISFESPNAVRVAVTAVAAVSDATGDYRLANNTATVVTGLSPAQGAVVDLQAVLTANVATQATGQPVTFTLTTTNLSPITAENVLQRVVLPASLPVAGFLVNGASGTLSGNTIVFANAVYSVSTGVLTFSNASTLELSATLTNTITVPAPGNSPLVATATVRADNPEEILNNNVAAATVTVTTQADVASTVSGPATTVTGATVTYSAVTVNNGPANATGVTSTMTLPAGATNVVLPAGATLTGNVVTFATSSTLLPGAANAVTYAVSFTAPAPPYTVASSVAGTSTDPNAGNNSSTTSTAPANQAPLVRNIVNTLQTPAGNTALALPIAPLVATDADGSIASYTIVALPTAAQGVLLVNGVVLNSSNFPGLVLTPAQAAQLQFDPAAGFVGNVPFRYTATDNGNGIAANAQTSPVAQYLLAVGQDNASLYTNTPTRGGNTPYTTGYVISNAFDTNGGSYSGAGTVADNGLRSVVLAPGSDPLPGGVSLNPATGQLFVSDASQLPRITSPTTYTVNITTVDEFGGITTQPVSFTLGGYPLPVELTVFKAQAVDQVDALLKWTTASERDNARFEVERSLDGHSFAKIGQVAGQGSTTAATAYALTDAGIGRQVNGLVYYRLRQVDRDGTFSYSPVRTVAFTKAITTPTISLYPNPATAETKLDLSQLPAGSYQVSVLDATGRVVVGLQLEAGLAHSLDLTKVASGAYTVLVRGHALNLTKRLIKH